MKILFTRFPFESAHGGAEAQTISLMKELQKRGHKVAFMGSCPTILVMCDQFNILSLELDIGKPPVSKWQTLRFLFKQKAMKKQLANGFQKFYEHGLEVLYMISLTEKLLLTPIDKKAGIKVIWIEHDSVGRWLRWNPFLSRLRKLSKEVITVPVSKLSKQKYVELGWEPDSVVAIPNGIEVQRFTHSSNQEPRTKNQEPTKIGAVARLNYEKGLDILIGSIADIPNVELAIVGVGSQETALQQLIAQNDLASRVQITNRLGSLAEFYEGLDIFVLPSRTHDPFGLVAAEAMCTGTPVIVTDACGIAEELESGKDALIVEAGSVQMLQKAIQALVENPKKREEIGKAGKKTATQEFTVERMVDKYEKVLSKSR